MSGSSGEHGVESGPELWAAAGLYDPDGAPSEDRLALLRWLDEQGVSLDEMIRADGEGRLFAVVGDRILRGTSPRISSAACAAAAGMSHERFLAIWRALGFPDPDAGDLLLTEEEASTLSIVAVAETLLGAPAVERLTGTISRAMRVIAEATNTAFIEADDSTMLDRSGSELVSAQVDALFDGLIPDFHRFLLVLHALHHEGTNRHLELAFGPVAEGTRKVHLAVAFADVSGYTALAAKVSDDELEAVVASFERWAADVVRRSGAQLVKTMGDGLMIVGSAGAVGSAALELVRPGAAPAGLLLHAGVALGSMRAVGGDYFGPTVNLAARLCGAASNGEVLAESAAAEAWASVGSAVDHGTRDLKGIDGSVQVWKIVHERSS